MSESKKNVLKKVLYVVLAVLGLCYTVICLPVILIVLIVSGIVCIARFPADYPKYKRSDYYKKYKQPYYTGIMKSDCFMFCSYIEKNNLDIEFVNNKKEQYFKRNNIIYFFSWFEGISFDESDKCVITVHEGWEVEDLKKIIENKEKEYNCDVKILIKEDDIEKQDIQKAYACDLLFVYKDVSDIENI